MQIGTLKLDVPLLLAPMAGITDLPFRVICRELGCGMTVSEMVSAKGLLYKNVKTFDMLRIDPGERPTAIQLFGSVPAELAEAARIVAGNGADVIDFNMGCPVPKVVNNGEGSALMKNPQLAYEILARMTDAVSVPVTVKFRAGWDSEHINAVKIPVIGNGDILTVADGQRMLAETGCDGLMLGRGADGNPWLFSRLQAALSGLPVPQEPPLKEKLALALRHLEMLIEYKNESVAVKEMRRHIGAYLKGMPKAAEYRGRFHQTETYADFKKLLAEYIEVAEKFGA